MSSGQWSPMKTTRPASASERGFRNLLRSLAPLDESQNPYAEPPQDYDEEHALELSEGGQRIAENNPDVIARRFEDFLDASSPLTEAEEKSYRRLGIEDQDRIVKRQAKHCPVFTSRYYVEQLITHSRPERRKWSLRRPQFSNDGGQHPLTFILRKLKLDVLLSEVMFRRDFILANGLMHLMTILRNVHKNQSKMIPSSTVESTQRALTDEHDVLVCVKFLMRCRAGAETVNRDQLALRLLLQSAVGQSKQCCAQALQALSAVAQRTGSASILSALTEQQYDMREPRRGATIVGRLNHDETPVSLILATVRFWNSIAADIGVASEARVALQYDLQRSGYDVTRFTARAHSSSGFVERQLQREINEWTNSCVNIAELTSQVRRLEERNTNLLREIRVLRKSLEQQQQVLQDKSQSVLELNQELSKMNRWKSTQALTSANSANYDTYIASNGIDDSTTICNIPQALPIDHINTKPKRPAVESEKESQLSEAIRTASAKINSAKAKNLEKPAHRKPVVAADRNEMKVLLEKHFQSRISADDDSSVSASTSMKRYKSAVQLTSMANKEENNNTLTRANMMNGQVQQGPDGTRKECQELPRQNGSLKYVTPPVPSCSDQNPDGFQEKLRKRRDTQNSISDALNELNAAITEEDNASIQSEGSQDFSRRAEILLKKFNKADARL